MRYSVWVHAFSPTPKLCLRTFLYTYFACVHFCTIFFILFDVSFPLLIFSHPVIYILITAFHFQHSPSANWHLSLFRWPSTYFPIPTFSFFLCDAPMKMTGNWPFFQTIGIDLCQNLRVHRNSIDRKMWKILFWKQNGGNFLQDVQGHLALLPRWCLVMGLLAAWAIPTSVAVLLLLWVAAWPI